MNALDLYKRTNGRMFPTCSEILEVIRSLGYEKRTDSPDPTAESVSPVETSDGSLSADGIESVAANDDDGV